MTENGSESGPGADIYRAPAAELVDTGVPDAEFYIVAPRKFLVLYLGTWGLYEIYWFYRHWRLYRDRHGLKLWPLPRAIFSIFFAYQLFSRIAHRGGDSAVRQWSPVWYAAGYILLYLVGNASQFADTGSAAGALLLVSLISLALLAALLYRVQGYANLACGDPRGESNSRYGAANLLWLGLGVLLWLGTLFIIGEILGLVPYSN